MFRVTCICMLSLISLTVSVQAEVTPMVQRHIFTPENADEQKDEMPPQKKVNSEVLEKELIFTGVIITPKGKAVIITEKGKGMRGKGEKSDQKQILKVGDEIKGMTIQEIGSNFVNLVNKENTLITLNLYKGGKVRPAQIPVETKPNDSSKAGQPKAGKTDDSGVPHPSPGNQTVSLETPSPFGSGGEKGTTENPQQPQHGEAPTNPFADIMNRAMRNASPPPSGVNPLLNLPNNR